MALFLDYKDKASGCEVSNPLIISANKPTAESYGGLSRALFWMKRMDVAILTAYRKRFADETPQILDEDGNFAGGTWCDKVETEGDWRKYSKTENKQRNLHLLSDICNYWGENGEPYGVTKVKGFYVEDGKKVTEESFFVVNHKDDPDFKTKIAFLSEKYNQESFLFKAKDNDEAELYFTNNYGNMYGKNEQIGSVHIQISAANMTFFKNGSLVFKK